ncbi:hypothetical protein WR25_22224 isoform A [Diploscapter pachys]|uniref:Uncharacterized protein n=3 Tax=Diploscapter pachys TaxID=2018661 RepID=A0A2A2KRY5_9BILA|nr:hypothetical protein WR25_22224 isoform A [Diploscapter pachys]
MDSFHVFYVNKGLLLLIELPNQTDTKFEFLCKKIHEATGVRTSDQVLLISNGEAIDQDKRVSNYASIGNSASPLYLFQKTSSRHERDEMSTSQEINHLSQIIDNAIDQADLLVSSSDVQAIYTTLPEKARGCKKAASSVMQTCARLVFEQQLLNQGWLALISNMDGSILKLRKRAARFQSHLDKVAQQNEKANTLLQGFDKVMEQLRKIKVPVSLLAHAQGKSDTSQLQEQTLYEWISAVDRDHSLEELIDEVRQQFSKFSEIDANTTLQEINAVVQQSKNAEFREIKGINKRLTQLDNSLLNAEKIQQSIEESVHNVEKKPEKLDANSLQELVADHKHHMQSIFKHLRDLLDLAKVFHNSKSEVLTNVRTRLGGWVVGAYEKLNSVHLEMLVFEEKLNGLKARLDLVQQIKEAPVVYATAVCEVIRRSTFQKEFTAWHLIHSEKCGNLTTEETTIRSTFTEKLERHFLRVLFNGMFDELPTFYVKNLAKFDQTIPPLTNEYLTSLRKCAQDLEEFLRVTCPQVFSRLAARDASSPPYLAQMKREESFFTPDPINNIAKLNNRFPSSNWLSEDGIDYSPGGAPTLLMAQSPPTSSSQGIPTAPSLHYLPILDDSNVRTHAASSSLAKSAPIQIPSSFVATNTRQMSEKSSQFSTPEDHFHPGEETSSGNRRIDNSDEGQFPLDDLQSRSQQSMEHLKPILYEVLHLSKGLLDIRAEVANNVDKFKDDFQKILKFSSTDLQERVQILNDAHSKEAQGLRDEIENLKTSNEEKDRELVDLRKEFETHKSLAESKSSEEGEEIQRLKEENSQLEAKAKEVEKEIFKKLTIEYELRAEMLRSEHDESIEAKEEELRELRKQLQRRDSEIAKLKQNPDSEESRKNVATEIRAELEKEFKSRIDLITKGVEQKKEEAVARHRKEMQYELRKGLTEMQRSLKWLTFERDELREAVGDEKSNLLNEKIQKKILQEEGSQMSVYGNHTSTQTDPLETPKPSFWPSAMPGSMITSQLNSVQSMMQSHYGEMKDSAIEFDSTPTRGKEEQTERDRAQSVMTVDVAAEKREAKTQTKMTMHTMQTMVAVEEISEGSTVLVIWDERHNAYILFSNSPYMHFVKDSSVRRLGLTPSTATGQRRNWIVGRVAQIEMCIVKKPQNRYNLPVNTRMCRVAVDAIPMASPSTKSKTGQPTTQPPATVTPTSPQSDNPQDTPTTSEA